jgi:hypothetical protein
VIKHQSRWGMSDAKIIASITAPAALILVGVYLFMTHRSENILHGEQPPPTPSAAPRLAVTNNVRPVTNAGPATSTTTPAPIPHFPVATTLESRRASTTTVLKPGDVAELSPKELLAQVDAFAPILIQRMKVDDATKDASLSFDDFKVTREYSVVSTDVQKTDSLIDPVVGVVQIHTFYWTVAKSSPTSAAGHSFTYTVTVSPQGKNKWKCVKADRKLESQHVNGRNNADGTVGQVTGSTDYIKRLIDEK